MTSKVQSDSVVAIFDANQVVTIRMGLGENVEDALNRSGFSLVAPDTSLEMPILHEYVPRSIFTDVDQKIKQMIQQATFANLRGQPGISFLNRIHFT
ncbi:MAG: hypothetical protein K1X28_08970 [Parachlamydiales bacterium]|nr:hypothetical protein [Parachlamydiales bacterium]